jgi:hypothetical protein
MKRFTGYKKALLIILALFIGCETDDNDQITETKFNEILYRHYPEFKTDQNIQGNHRTIKLLEYLANNQNTLSITELRQLRVTTKQNNNENGRSLSTELWELIQSDSTVFVRDIIVPIYISDNSSNARTSSIDCECVSTATGLKLPKDLCGCPDEDNSTGGSGGTGTSSGTPTPTAGITYGSPSSVEAFFNSYPSGGGVSVGTNTTGGEIDMLLYSLDIGNRSEFEWIIDQTQDSETRRILQLKYINDFGGAEGQEFKIAIESMIGTPKITVGDVMEINNTVQSMYLRLKAEYMMAIFSPDNVGTILMLALSGNTTATIRNKFFNVLPRYSAYAEVSGMIGSKTWTVGGVSVTFKGYTTHGTISYGISKGFTPQLIKTILSNGTVTRVPYGNGYQLRILYPHNGQTLGIVIDANPGTFNFGKIVTYLTNY